MNKLYLLFCMVHVLFVSFAKANDEVASFDSLDTNYDGSIDKKVSNEFLCWYLRILVDIVVVELSNRTWVRLRNATKKCKLNAK